MFAHKKTALPELSIVGQTKCKNQRIIKFGLYRGAICRVLPRIIIITLRENFSCNISFLYK